VPRPARAKKSKHRAAVCQQREKGSHIMELNANSGKQVSIQVDGAPYDRYAIKTHFVKIGEDYISLVEQYVKPHFQAGDFLSISEKIIALCQKRVVYKKDMKLSRMAKFLSRFAASSSAGIGVDSPWKMQFAIDLCGRWKVFWAAVAAGFGKLFGKKGVFYNMVGMEVTGLDGFYDHVFEEYGNYGIRIPENPAGVCNEIYEKTGVPCMIVDANDLTIEILGHGDHVSYSEEQMVALIQDNPAGQSDELTPFILIRPAEAPAAPENTAPETAAPETAAPENTAPETAAPENTAPETAAPETTAPEADIPAES
jgi:hypothetical protein